MPLELLPVEDLRADVADYLVDPEELSPLRIPPSAQPPRATRPVPHQNDVGALSTVDASGLRHLAQDSRHALEVDPVDGGGLRNQEPERFVEPLEARELVLVPCRSERMRESSFVKRGCGQVRDLLHHFRRVAACTYGFAL